MSSTLIDVRAVISCSGRIRRIKSTVSGIQSSFRTTKGRIDDSIMDAELASTLSQINNQLGLLNSGLIRLAQTIEKGADAYVTADGTIRAWGMQISSYLINSYNISYDSIDGTHPTKELMKTLAGLVAKRIIS